MAPSQSDFLIATASCGGGGRTASTSRPVIPGSFFPPSSKYFFFLCFLFLFLSLSFFSYSSSFLSPSFFFLALLLCYGRVNLSAKLSPFGLIKTIFSNATVARFLVAAGTFWSICMVTSSCHFDFHFFNMWLSLITEALSTLLWKELCCLLWVHFPPAWFSYPFSCF